MYKETKNTDLSNVEKWDIPIKSKNHSDYILFKNTLFDRIEYQDCNDTVTGTCLTNIKNVDDCIKICKEANTKENKDVCSYGYFIENGENKIF